MRDRTSIVVSHRVTAVMDADQILVLEEGRVAEPARTPSCSQQQGVYATLQQRQLLAERAQGQKTSLPDASRRDLDWCTLTIRPSTSRMIELHLHTPG